MKNTKKALQNGGPDQLSFHTSLPLHPDVELELYGTIKRIGG